MIAARKTAAVGSETTQIVSNTIGRIILCSPAASRLAATAIKRASKSISRVMQISSAAFSDRSEVATHDRASTTPCRMAA